MGTGRSADHGPRPPWRRELTIWLVLVAFYFIMTAVDWSGRHRTAMTNSRWLFDLERSLHVDIEPSLNRWLAPRDGLRIAANYEYAITYLVSSFGVLVWLYLRRPATYPWARTSFIVLNVISLICFKVYPVAPPRLVPDLGFVDTVVLDRTWGSWGSPWASRVNQLAAMPSLHIGWALWVSLILVSIASGWQAQAVSGVHVLVTLLVIMATANHYLIDAVGGAVLTAACMAVTRPRADGSSRWDPAIAAIRQRLDRHRPLPQVGQVVLLEFARAPNPASLDGELRRAVERVARRHVDEVPRLRQRHARVSRWRSPRWVDHPNLDWSWHVAEHRPANPDAEARLYTLVAEATSEPLPNDRPLWRLLVIPVRGNHAAAVITVAHHTVADGIHLIAKDLASM